MPSSEKSKCCGAYVTRRFFMPCYSCACLMGGLCTAALLYMWSYWLAPLYGAKSEHLEEILALRRVWITLRQQLHECLSPGQGRVVGQLL